MVLRLPFLRRAFVGASVAWFGALPLATLAASEPHPSTVVYLGAFFVYLAGGVLCHQLPARSFSLWGSQMPVCARCTGIYAGAAVTAIVATVRTFCTRRGGPVCPAFARPRMQRATARLAEAPKARRRPRRADTWVVPYEARAALVLAVMPTILTLAYEWTTGQTPANWIRAAAGVPIGVIVAWIVCGRRPEAVEG
jgi:hypothetical protein